MSSTNRIGQSQEQLNQNADSSRDYFTQAISQLHMSFMISAIFHVLGFTYRSNAFIPWLLSFIRVEKPQTAQLYSKKRVSSFLSNDYSDHTESEGVWGQFVDLSEETNRSSCKKVSHWRIDLHREPNSNLLILITHIWTCWKPRSIRMKWTESKFLCKLKSWNSCCFSAASYTIYHIRMTFAT